MNVVARRTLPGRSGATPLTFAVLFAAAAVVLLAQRHVVQARVAMARAP